MLIKIRLNPETKHVQARSQITLVSLIIAALCGFLLVVYLIIDSGAADVAHAMLVIGWWLIPITLFHLVPLAFSALSWRELLPASIVRMPSRYLDTLDPRIDQLALAGSQHRRRYRKRAPRPLRGVPGAQAAASMVVDTTVGAATELIFVMSGVALLLMRSTERSALVVAWAVLIGTGVLFAASPHS